MPTLQTVESQLEFYAKKRWGDKVRITYSAEHQCYVMRLGTVTAYAGKGFSDGINWVTKRHARTTDGRIV